MSTSLLSNKRGTTLRSRKSSGGLSSGRLYVTLCCGLTGILGFYAGVMISSSGGSGSVLSDEAVVQDRVQTEVRRILQQQQEQQLAAAYGNDDDTAPRFPTSVQDTVRGMATVDRDDFMSAFDTGVPRDLSTDHNREVLLLYQSQDALPSTNAYTAAEAVHQTTLPSIASAQEAVQNCDFLNIVLTDHGNRRQCTALVGQYEAFHVQKFMRLPRHGKLDPAQPLRLVNRGAQASGRKSTQPPKQSDTLLYWTTTLPTYLSTFETVLQELQPLLERVAVNNAVTVLVCNLGQSELLLNFVCSARQHRKLDLSHLLVFATDVETRDLMQAAGVNVFYDATNYGDMPKQAAGRYADKTFTTMMMAKVFCVHMVSWLGYDVLFQDVDVIWYRDPLPYFYRAVQNEEESNDETDTDDFDIYFQDDGNHALFYAPYSANTGFYYVRANERTRHFFNSFLMAGDLILSTHSHQIPLVALLQEHASMYGLRVKILSRTEDDFPGGHAFHRRKSFMQDIIAGAVQPYIMHMSWTKNKDNKIKFYRQLGEWFLQDQCIQKTVDQITDSSGGGAGADLLQSCCAAEPLFSCHYRDKPSKLPCKDAPPIDQGAKSWW